MSAQKVIPQYEPEIVEAMARKHYHGDTEKVPTTPIRELTVSGVTITSRYQKAHELELMRAVILALSPRLAEAVKSIWCDSKANYSFSVVLRGWNQTTAEVIGASLDRCLQSARPFGHNGIDISADETRNPGSVYIDPYWRDYDESTP